MHVRAKVASAAIAALAAAGATAAVAVPSASADHRNQIQHVLLVSVDGMHQSDLNWYIENNPASTLARLASGGAEYTNNHTSDPSDSDPGGTAIMTGGDPKTTGVYYDVEYSHGVDEPAYVGTTATGATCTPGQAARGGDVIYDSPDDKLNNVADLQPGNTSGQTFPSFDEDGSVYAGGDDTDPAKIMDLTPTPQTGLNPATFPVDPSTCQPIMP